MGELPLPVVAFGKNFKEIGRWKLGRASVIRIGDYNRGNCGDIFTRRSWGVCYELPFLWGMQILIYCVSEAPINAHTKFYDQIKFTNGSFERSLEMNLFRVSCSRDVNGDFCRFFLEPLLAFMLLLDSISSLQPAKKPTTPRNPYH